MDSSNILLPNYSSSTTFRDFITIMLDESQYKNLTKNSSDENFNLAVRILTYSINRFAQLEIPLALFNIITDYKVPRFVININLVNTDEISLLNEEFYSGERSPTDILTFPYYQVELWGELFICPIIAKSKGAARGELFEKYMQRLLVHGILHLFLGHHSDLFEDIEEHLLNQLTK